MSTPLPFIPGNSQPRSSLLARYLPPVPGGIAEYWAKKHLPQGSWILDPFGVSPQMASELARAGYRILVTANNPISRLLYELAADPPTESELQSALAELAAVRKGDERLEVHLRSLYQTRCAQCGQRIEARTYLWERDAQIPYAKNYQCSYCGDSGERPLDPGDIELAQSFQSTGLHRARALERIAPKGDPDRIHAEEAISAYLPRAIYAITTLINRLELLKPEDSLYPESQEIHRRCLFALALLAFDKGNVLWSHLTDRPRPRQLIPSPHFQENNLWLALEGAPLALSSQSSSVPITTWPNQVPESGGLTIFEGPVREFASVLSEEVRDEISEKRVGFDAVISALPRPNQAYWTLSALWAGWLWGREAIGPFISVLRRRRYDWAWHCTALNFAFSAIKRIINQGPPIFACLCENEASFLSAALLAAHSAGLELQGFAIRQESDLAQALWRSSRPEILSSTQANPAVSELNIENKSVGAAKHHLDLRGEPAPYILLHAAALEKLFIDYPSAGSFPEPPGDSYSLIHPQIEESFSTKNGFTRYGGGEKSLETSLLWCSEISSPTVPLADWVEIAVVEYLRAHTSSSYTPIDEDLCQEFPGLFTPDSILSRICVESYTEPSQENGVRTLRMEDHTNPRQAEIESIRSSLVEIGSRMGFGTRGDKPLIWTEKNEQPKFVFYILATSAIWDIVVANPFSPQISFIVLPGARVNILIHKLRHNPLLRQEIDKGWRILKYRHIRHLLESPSLSSENFEEMLSLDPLTESPAQMRLL